MTRSTLLICLVAVAAISIGSAAREAEYQRTEDVIYGHKAGVALTMDVFQPAKPNHTGVICLVSGGWFSSREMINPAAYGPLLSRGYTVFAVMHGSQPKFTIPEIIKDVQRSVRFIRHNAASYGIDPRRLGVTGGSAGGHLSLVLGTFPGNGDEGAKDPVERESAGVQCVACFFPPTDFLNYGGTNVDGTGVGLLEPFKAAFGPQADTVEGRKKLGREISPIYHISSNMPPMLIIHGNADPIVPIQQSESFVKRAHEMGDIAELIVKDGKGHGWPNWQADLALCADWFDKYLRGIKK